MPRARKVGRNCFALAGVRVIESLMRLYLRFLTGGFGIVALLVLLPWPVSAGSDPAHVQADSKKPEPWPGGIIPYDISKLTPGQQAIALRAMRRWMDTGAKIEFFPRTTEAAYVNFTGKTNAGNNTSHVGFRRGE